MSDKNVYEYMTRNDCRIGGEQNGCIILNKYANTGDGIRSSRKVNQMVVGSLLSVAVEVVQLIARQGRLELDDWLFNTLSTALGCLLYRRLFPRDARECESN